MHRLPLVLLSVILISILDIAVCTHVSIVGGKEAKGPRPWMVSIQVQKQHICGGILIKDQWVLTAAHCKRYFSNEKYVTVLLGAHSLSDETKTIRMKTWSFEVPQTFNENTKSDDIMLIKLNQKVKVRREKVKKTKLPKSHSDIPPGTKCVVTGWGATRDKAKKCSDTLQEAEVRVLARGVCNRLYQSDPVITEDMLCAANEMTGGDACWGDSGGPLRCNDKLVGLVSGGSGCGNPKKPGVYTRLSKRHLTWINHILKKHSNITFTEESL
ncbi:granzyme K-like [Denticeps clupeoides]|uniref:Peptidase S1 domain-containing protein n=1 Tax=Denticeps clupeoides TaxID=299321 RepID=A0AAY4BQU9_9TELE|nr:granzyme K-like [Denticeps clupeoides]